MTESDPMKRKIGPSTDQQSAINAFLTAAKRLREVKVIRSHRFLGDLGDLGEFICACAFGFSLAANQREPGLDGWRKGARVQVKYHGGKTTTADLGKPTNYE